LQSVVILGDSNADGIEDFRSEFTYFDCRNTVSFQHSIDCLRRDGVTDSIYFSTFFNFYRDWQKDLVERFVTKVEKVCREFPNVAVTVQLPYYRESDYFTTDEGGKVNTMFKN
jgi:hypothetical protein